MTSEIPGNPKSGQSEATGQPHFGHLDQKITGTSANHGGFAFAGTSTGPWTVNLHSSGQHQSEDEAAEKNACLSSLAFDGMDDRRFNVEEALNGTCDWLFKNHNFQDWLNGRAFNETHGVFWIRGKPGSGKSTILKHALAYCEEEKGDHSIIASYFFHSRSSDPLHKSPLGMIRSLLHQILDQSPYLYKHFLPVFRRQRKQGGKVTLGTLWRHSSWNLLKQTLKTLMTNPSNTKDISAEPRPVYLFLDALDECVEADIRTTFEFIEWLSAAAVRSPQTSQMHICLSSRTFPNFTIRKKTELLLDKQPDHAHDIEHYVNETLPPEIHDMTLVKRWWCNKDMKYRRGTARDVLPGKAQNTFTWIFLVASKLKEKYDEGTPESQLRELVEELPAELDALFEEILIKDNPSKQETLHLLEWMLYYKKDSPIFGHFRARHLYDAVLAGTNPGILESRNQLPSDEEIKRFITHRSRDLVDVTKYGGVEFVHRTVSDFLTRLNRIKLLDPSLSDNPVGQIHLRLSDSCLTYIRLRSLSCFHEYPSVIYQDTGEARTREDLDEEAFTRICGSHPLLDYIVRDNGLLFHWAKAEFAGMPMDNRLRDFIQIMGTCTMLASIHDWILFQPARGNPDIRTLSREQEHQVPWLRSDPRITRLLYGPDISPLAMVVSTVHTNLLISLLQLDALPNSKCGLYDFPLRAAIALRGDRAVADTVQILLEAGADVNAQGGFLGNALQAIACKAPFVDPKIRKDVIRLLLGAGADIHVNRSFFGNALQAACSCGLPLFPERLHARGTSINPVPNMVEDLLSKSPPPDVNAVGGYYGTALAAAANATWELQDYDSEGHIFSVLELLVNAGADASTRTDWRSVLANAFGSSLKPIMMNISESVNSNRRPKPAGELSDASSESDAGSLTGDPIRQLKEAFAAEILEKLSEDRERFPRAWQYGTDWNKPEYDDGNGPLQEILDEFATRIGHDRQRDSKMHMNSLYVAHRSRR